MTRNDFPETAGPVRTCIGCRKRASKSDLLRVTAGVQDDQSVVLPDPSGVAVGRGAHLHPTIECYDLAVRRRAFARALRHADPSGLSSVPVGAYVAGHVTE